VAFAAQHPAMRNPYAALPQMRLLTYQMPDELLAIASGGEFDEFDLNAFFEAKGTRGQAVMAVRLRCQCWRCTAVRARHVWLRTVLCPHGSSGDPGFHRAGEAPARR